jgi:hypothetical protein
LVSLAFVARAESLTLLPTKFTLDSPGDEEVDYWVNDSPSRQSHEEKRAIYLDGDTVFGQWSDVATIAVTG